MHDGQLYELRQIKVYEEFTAEEHFGNGGRLFLEAEHGVFLCRYYYLSVVFLKSKLDTQPRFKEKTVVIHNFIEKREICSANKGGYVLEFGHLSKDKGTLTLLEAARQMPEVKFVFAGFGKAVEEIEKVPNAEYVGFKTGRS